ncbi:MAG: hypothetical protein K1X28_01975 [Parachlamydiales bacterium]|nr:hypothetical protein [Parachlamydiales bacterium]
MVKELYRYKLQKREGLILKWDHGLGEIAPLPGFSKETLLEAETELKAWVLENRSPTLPSARFGIASAQRPLESVNLPLCALGSKKGFPTVKLKTGHLSIPDAIHLAKDHLKLKPRLDCNKAWSLEQALEFASHFKPTDFDYLEEPVKSEKELIEFSKITQFPIALDESIHMDWSQIPSLKTIVVKPTIVGFVPKIPLKYRLVLSSSYESGLGLIHIANLAKGHLPIGLDTVFQDDLLLNPIQCSNGEFVWEKSDPVIDFAKLCRVL